MEEHLDSLERDNKREFTANDLVLLRRTELDSIYSRKLEIRWRRPLVIARVLNNYRSVILNDLTSGLRVKKFHIDYIKKFVARTNHPREEGRQLAK